MRDEDCPTENTETSFETRPEGALTARPTGSQVLPAELYDRYELQEVLGRGGMGVVFRARDQRLGRDVAVKTLSERFARENPTALELYGREIAALASLSHPNVVRVLDAAALNAEFPHIVMEYVEGPNLADFLRLEQPPQALRLRLMGDVCEGVEHIHRAGYLHRDIKPANIVVHSDGEGGRPRAVVVDFGLALDLRDGALADSSAAAGTRPYLSPEQRTRPVGELDRRSDVYSLGVTLHYVLRETLPERDGAYDGSPGESPEVGAILRKALATDRRRRYPDAQSLAHDIASYLAGRPVDAYLELGLGTDGNRGQIRRIAYRAGKRAQRNRALFLGTGVVVVFAAAALSVAAWQHRTAGQTRAEEARFFAAWSQIFEDVASGSLEVAQAEAEALTALYPEGSDRWARARYLASLVSLVGVNAEFKTRGPVAGDLAPFVAGTTQLGEPWRSSEERATIRDELQRRGLDLVGSNSGNASANVGATRALVISGGSRRSGYDPSASTRAELLLLSLLINLDQFDEARSLLDEIRIDLGATWEFRYLAAILEVRELGSRALPSAPRLESVDAELRSLESEGAASPEIQSRLPELLFNRAMIRRLLGDEEAADSLLRRARSHPEAGPHLVAWIESNERVEP